MESEDVNFSTLLEGVTHEQQIKANRALIKIVKSAENRHLSDEDCAKIKECIEQGANPNCRVGKFVQPLLCRAIAESNLSLFDCLIEIGVNVNALDMRLQGFSPLHYAVQLRNDSSNKSYMLRKLLEFEADVDAESPHGTPLSFAVKACDVRLVELLVNHGANVDIPTSHGLLSSAVAGSRLDVIQKRCDSGDSFALEVVSSRLILIKELCNLGAPFIDDHGTVFHSAIGCPKRVIEVLMTHARPDLSKEIINQKRRRQEIREKVTTAFWVLKELGISEDVKCLILSRLFVDNFQGISQGLPKQLLCVAYKYPDIIAQVDKRVAYIQEILQNTNPRGRKSLGCLLDQNFSRRYIDEVKPLLDGSRLCDDVYEFKGKLPDIVSLPDSSLVRQMCINYETLLDDEKE